MDSQKEYWNEVFELVSHKAPHYDLWLDKYENVLSKSKDTPILDLGCGFGNDTLYLKERGYEVISCDISEKALYRLSNYIKDLKVKCFDLKDGLPFQDSCAKVIISDLSLHYFTWKETEKVLKEIDRVLMEDGVLLCRVNSTKDTNYGAGKGIVVEENYYNIDGRYKRFFNETQLRELFKHWEIQYINESVLNRYKLSKVVWEISVRKLKCL